MSKYSARGGEYRSMFVTLYDDRDFQNLTPLAQSLLHILKGQLGPYGIAVFYPVLLPVFSRKATQKDIEHALVELETPKPGKQYGWLKREDSIYWLVNALKYETWWRNHTKPHALAAQRYAASLPKLPIVEEFLAYYQLLEGRGGVPTPLVGGEPTPVLGGTSESESERDTDTESESESEMQIEGLPPAACRLAFGYKDPKRRGEVVEQLRASLTKDGARIKKGEYAYAENPAHLDKCCRAVLASPPDKPDAAIVFVLKKLTAPNLNEGGLTRTEAATAAASAERVAAGRKDEEFFAEWERANPDLARELNDHAETTYPGSDDFTKVQRMGFYRACVVERVEQAQRGAA